MGVKKDGKEGKGDGKGKEGHGGCVSKRSSEGWYKGRGHRRGREERDENGALEAQERRGERR